MTEHAEMPRQEEGGAGGKDKPKWVRVELPKDAIAQESITAQEIVEVMKEARREWVERVVGKGGGEKKTAGG